MQRYKVRRERKLQLFFMIALCVFVFLSSGCATVLNGSTQTIPVSSNPSGANILLNGQLVGKTPASVEIRRKRDHVVTLVKTGYYSASMPVTKKRGVAVWGNILAGGLMGWGVDVSTGAQYNLIPAIIFITLEKAKENDKTASVVHHSVWNLTACWRG